MKKLVVSTWRVEMVILILVLSGCTKSPPSSTILYHVIRVTTPAQDGSEPIRKIELWKMMPDGSDIIQITSSGWYGEYSPDNSKIAFSEFYDSGIWTVNADGTDPIQLTSSGSGPSWSPDGSQLVFHAYGTKGADRYIWIMNADGKDAKQLSTVNGSFAHWSPQGDRIIFHGEVNHGIFLIDPDGSNETMLYRFGGYPAWSPNGEEIAYVDLNDWCIWVMDADGSNKRKLTDHHGNQPTWSPNGFQIAYEVEGKEDVNGIWIINSDGSDDHRINKEGRHPDWSN